MVHLIKVLLDGVYQSKENGAQKKQMGSGNIQKQKHVLSCGTEHFSLVLD